MTRNATSSRWRRLLESFCVSSTFKGRAFLHLGLSCDLVSFTKTDDVWLCERRYSMLFCFAVGRASFPFFHNCAISDIEKGRQRHAAGSPLEIGMMNVFEFSLFWGSSNAGKCIESKFIWKCWSRKSRFLGKRKGCRERVLNKNVFCCFFPRKLLIIWC